MITLSDWYKFNCIDNKIMDTLGDIYIKMFRKKSLKTDDRCFCQLMRIDDAIKLFGSYPLYKINFYSEQRDSGFEYKALCALLYMEEEAND